MHDEEELAATPTPSAGLELVRLPPGSYREREEEEEEQEEADDAAYAPGRGITSSCKGVSWDTRTSRWQARGWDIAKGKTVHIGCYAIEQDAARAYQEYVEHGTLPTRAAPTSTFRDVSWHKGKRKWQVKISKNGKHISLGSF
jgi:hypothetical protein